MALGEGYDEEMRLRRADGNIVGSWFALRHCVMNLEKSSNGLGVYRYRRR